MELSYLEQIFENVEWYVMMLAWITLPLGFVTLFLLLRNHSGFFGGRGPSEEPTESDKSGPWHA